jgi:hypothetical protein
MIDMTLTIPSSSFLAEAGTDMDLFPVPSDFTVAQAAKILDMSEACLNEYLDNGIIEFREDAGCRLIDREYLIEYKRGCDFRRAGLIEIMRLSEEMGLYDDE